MLSRNNPVMLLLIFITGIVFCQGAHFPAGIKLCHRSDPNFVQCVGKNFGPGLALFANGSRQYGIPKLEPFFIEEMVMKGTATETISIEQKYKNVYLSGITNSNCEQNFNLDIDKGILVMDVVTPIMTLEADYELTGKLLMFPLNAHGKCKITIYNMLNTHSMKGENYESKGKTYWKITNYSMDMRPEKLDFYFENVFPGNEQISAEILKTVNDNNLLIFNDIKSSFEQVFSTIHLATLNKFFSKVPLNEIYLD